MKLILFIFAFVAVSQVSSECNFESCNSNCGEIQFENGKCIDDLCACYKSEHGQAAVFENFQRLCNNDKCSDWCWKIGYPGGVCSFGICRCYKWDPKTNRNQKEIL